MKKIVSIAVLAFVSFCFVSCRFSCDTSKTDDNDGIGITSVRKVRPFDKIVINAPCEVIYTQGDTLGVKVVGEKESVKKIVTTCKGSTLIIDFNEKTKLLGLSVNYGDVGATVYITTPDLIGVHLNGAGNFESQKIVDTDTLNVSLKGAGDIVMNGIICDELHGMLRGVGNMELKSLTAKKTDMTLTGVGNVEINFKNSGFVKCTLQGVGNIDLSGDVRKLNTSLKGTGEIDTDNLNIKE